MYPIIVNIYSGFYSQEYIGNTSDLFFSIAKDILEKESIKKESLHIQFIGGGEWGFKPPNMIVYERWLR